MITEWIQDLRQGASAEEKVAKLLEELQKSNMEDHYLNAICKEQAIAAARAVDKKVKSKQQLGKLAGIPISVKDCLCVKGVESTAGSKMLKGYHPLFDATAVERCRNQDAIIIGKTSQDEFGFGGFSVNVGKDYQIPKNPVDSERSCGGSSGGAAGLTKKANIPALAESTGGSIVNPAAFCGVYGLCPTYGRVSRYGLIDYASSLDKIGPMATSIEDAALLMEIIAGHDNKDATSSTTLVDYYTTSISKGVKKLKLGIVKEAFPDNSEVESHVWKSIKKLEAAGSTYQEISLPKNAAYGIPAYYIIAMSEASTNLAKLCGMRYGMQEKIEGDYNTYFTKVRSNFGQEAKRRILLGTFARMAGYRDAYYLKALSVRKMLQEEYAKAFKDVDVIITPTMPIVAPKFSEISKLTPLQHYQMDVLTVGPNLAGLPHLSIPSGTLRKMPVGMMAIAPPWMEKRLIQLGGVL